MIYNSHHGKINVGDISETVNPKNQLLDQISVCSALVVGLRFCQSFQLLSVYTGYICTFTLWRTESGI